MMDVKRSAIKETNRASRLKQPVLSGVLGWSKKLSCVLEVVRISSAKRKLLGAIEDAETWERTKWKE